VSSSGHLTLVPRLLGWDHDSLPADVRKSFDVALHAGSLPAVVAALLTLPRGDAAGDAAAHEASGGPRARFALDPLTLLPPALAGALFERPIERRLGGARAVALAQIAAGLALLAADWRPESRTAATTGDRLAVGLAQAAALVPGVSRSGAALTVARWRGLSRGAAAELSLRAALPVTAGAAALKGLRAARGGVPPELRGPVAAGAAAACVSAFAALPLARSTRWRAVAGYRIALGLFALRRVA
jgi:undecaprenyl-diphosphatase